MRRWDCHCHLKKKSLDFEVYVVKWSLRHERSVIRVRHTIHSLRSFQVAIRGTALGIVFGLGVLVSFSGWTCSHFGWYMCALSFFHWSEFMSTAVTNPCSLSLESFLLDHSKEYHIAAVASWIEFVLEWYLFPGGSPPCSQWI